MEALEPDYNARQAGGPAALPELADSEFVKWADLVERRLGVVIPPARRSFLATNLRMRMWEIGCTDYRSYFHILSGSADSPEWETLLDRLTVHETRFFRNDASLAFVRQQCLPGVPGPGRPSFRAWSVGCATGEEAYTLAMVIDAWFAARGTGYEGGVTGTDVSLPALNAARAGCYPQRRLADIPAALRRAYCRGVDGAVFEIAPQLRRRVSFSRWNLLDMDQAPVGAMDLIYCQNVLIYFDRPRREAIASELAEHLAPGGALVLGPGELLGWSHPGMQRVCCDDTLAYRRATTWSAKERP
ncbi:MAG TPA: CheR family methyltransferase [Gammaproteobacteria bacterium]|nr:CheR family methyltransferase [Gammaproteobacteria bacterium]